MVRYWRNVSIGVSIGAVIWGLIGFHWAYEHRTFLGCYGNESEADALIVHALGTLDFYDPYVQPPNGYNPEGVAVNQEKIAFLETWIKTLPPGCTRVFYEVHVERQKRRVEEMTRSLRYKVEVPVPPPFSSGYPR